MFLFANKDAREKIKKIEEFLCEFEKLRDQYNVEVCKVGESIMFVRSHGNREITCIEAITAFFCSNCTTIYKSGTHCPECSTGRI
jgi:hypothetical protein